MKNLKFKEKKIHLDSHYIVLGEITVHPKKSYYEDRNASGLLSNKKVDLIDTIFFSNLISLSAFNSYLIELFVDIFRDR